MYIFIQVYIINRRNRHNCYIIVERRRHTMADSFFLSILRLSAGNSLALPPPPIEETKRKTKRSGAPLVRFFIAKRYGHFFFRTNIIRKKTVGDVYDSGPAYTERAKLFPDRLGAVCRQFERNLSNRRAHAYQST